MKITRIKIDYKDGDGVKADFSITFNHCLTINFGHIIEYKNTGERFITFPYIKKGDEWLELAHPTSKEFRNEISNKILNLYDNGLDEYVKTDATEGIKVTDINSIIVNPNDGIFETEVVLNNSIRIHKILMKKDDCNYSYQYPFSKTVNDKKIDVISFDTDELKKDVMQSFVDWYFTNYVKMNNKYATSDVKTPEERREKSNQKIKSQGIVCYENLGLRENGNDLKLKDIDTICKKAIASLLVIQVACDINNGKYQESIEYFSKIMDKFGVTDYLNKKERRIYDGTYSKQDVIDIDWEYETYWAIIWALGLVNDISDASNICDCTKAYSFVLDSKNYEDFKSKCKMRTVEEILDMLDLYFRYDWAVTEKRIKPDTPIGKLNSSVVVERRRGLEWLISNKEDWYDILLNT